MTDITNSRYFKTYILKTLTQISPDNSLTTEGLNTIETAIRSFCLRISNISYTLCVGRDSKTISDGDIKTATKLFFPTELFNHGKEEILKAVLKYTSYSNKKDEKVQRETKAGLIVSASLVEKYLRENSDLKVSENSIIALAAISEYFLAEILDVSSKAASDDKKVRINNRHILVSVYNDVELKQVFEKLNIFLPNCGTVPHIEQFFVDKVQEIKDTKKNTGLICHKNILKEQKSLESVIPYSQFEKTMRHYAKQQVMLNEAAVNTFRSFVEYQTVEMLKKVNKITIHASRETLQTGDFKLYFNLNDLDIDESEIDLIGVSCIRKLSYRAGVFRMANESWPIIRDYICYLIDFYTQKFVSVLNNCNKKIISLEIVQNVFNFENVVLPLEIYTPRTKKVDKDIQEESVNSQVEAT